MRTAIVITLALAASLMAKAASIPNAPLSVQVKAPSMVMIVAGRDHRLFYEAYNDASDLDGDGTIDYRFKPDITYLGLFDPNLCYRYNRDRARFEPQARASGSQRTCSGLWSGNWLNYVTTARIDALRVVLYGGFREVDTPNETVLRRAYIPQDAHSWAKEYESIARDGYDIRQYTPLPLPSQNRRHFFGNLTRVAGVDCGNLPSCSDHRPPILAVVENSYKRVWQWASKERPVLDDSHGGRLTDYTVRVLVCTDTFHDGCKQYPNGKYKPVGLLHEFSENNAMLFGLLTGSYDRNQNGGRLRKVVSSFSTEYDPHTGIFRPLPPGSPAQGSIYWTLNNLRIRDFNNGVWGNGNYYRGGWILNRSAMPGEFPDWSNPVGEMLYEAMRYFAGRRLPTRAYMGSRIIDHQVGLISARWDDPYRRGRDPAPRCAQPNILAVSDVNVSYDSDDLPGAYFGRGLFGDLPGLNVRTLADEITRNERLPATTFIGQSGSYYDTAPTPKRLDSLGTIRGLWEEPTHQGSYYSAAVAYYGKKTDIRPDLPGTQSVNTFVVALSSPLPRIEVPAAGGRRITLVPFAKSVSARGGGISPARGAFQPTNQIVDFYVDTIVNSGPHDQRPDINGGRYYARFVINFEDVEQGADHDMDAVVHYEVWTRHDGSVGVKLTPTYEAGSIRHRMGYVISGTTADGTYLEVQDEPDYTAYFLNTPPGKRPGHCDPPTGKPECNRLPYLRGNPGSATRVFWPGSSSASFLENPLWYAAKWGSFKDLNGNNKPDLTEEWDENGDGQPDGYFLVRNPTMLREKLRATLESIAARSGSHSRISVSSSTITGDTAVYSARFNTAEWSGDVIAQKITATGVSPNPLWRASSQMLAPNSRNLWVRRSDGSVVPFSWNQLTPSDQSLLGNNADVLQYLRGDRSKELQNGGTLRNRPLGNVIGDIIHSNVFYAKNTRTVFVGANDGMLHAFDARTGRELFAYIPRAVLPRLKNLTKPNYTHEYFVDGESAWIGRELVGKDILVTTLGRGGRALFALDVSDPARFSDRHALWETGFDPDLGYVLSRPIIAKLNNGQWGVIVGNGYNSDNKRAVLFIYELNTGVLIRKIDTQAGGDNGLAGPEGWDDDGDGDIDYVYAGDLNGNVWKFDLRDSYPAQWKIAYGTPNSPQPLFVARDHTGQRQPITAPMTVVLNNAYGSPAYGKRYVIFGTGSYFRNGDASSTQRQSWYGLIDNGTPIAGRNELASSGIAREGMLDGRLVRTFASPPDLTGKKGWYLDFSTRTGERVVSKSRILPLLRPALAVSSIIPDRDPCSPGGSGFVNVIDPFTGGRIDLGVIDVNNNNDFNDDKLEDVYIGGLGFAPDFGMPGEPVLTNNQLVVGGSAGNVESMRVVLGRGLLGRTSWREIVKD